MAFKTGATDRLYSMMRTPLLALTLTFLALASGTAEAQAPSPFHVEIGAAYQQQTADYVSMTDVVPICPDGRPAETCAPTGRTLNMVRGLGAIGWGGLNLEASVAMPVDGDIDLTQFGLGIRLDTSYLGVFSVYLRAHYLMQSGDVEAQGGHFGLGMQVWAIPQMAFYAEAAADITSVNEEMQNQGTLFSYARYFGGGIRFRFAPGS